MKQRSFEEWQRADAAHYMHPFTDSKALAAKGTRVITRGEGIYIYDANGHKMLDGMSGLWCVNVGYGRKELIEAATQQMTELPFYNSFFQCAHPPAIRLAELLSEVTPPHMNHVFFTSSGSEANDTVIRMVRHYWASVGQPNRTVIISRENAYHGSTMGGGSLGGMTYIHKQGGLPISRHRAHSATVSLRLSRQSVRRRVRHRARARSRAPHRVGGRRPIAAFIGEPIQGAGGVIMPPASYWPEIRRICEKYGILLVVDEVITGFGRTGRWFASEYYDLQPDLLVMAKGMSSGYLPIGGVMVRDRVANVIRDTAAISTTVSRIPATRPAPRLRHATSNCCATSASSNTCATLPRRISRRAGQNSPSIRWLAKRARSDCSARSTRCGQTHEGAISAEGARR
jgi:putrescine aminotransferase